MLDGMLLALPTRSSVGKNRNPQNGLIKTGSSGK
jgi:hypothetical protein